MEDNYSTRFQDLSSKHNLSKVKIDASTLQNILFHALEGQNEEGFGALFGVYNKEDQTINIKSTIELILENGITKEDENTIIRQMGLGHIQENSYYRQIGFYIISDENQQFQTEFIHYLINNNYLKYPNIFLHLNPSKIKKNNGGIHFYKINEEYDKALNGKVLAEQLFYQFDEGKLLNLVNDDVDFFIKVDYEVEQSPIFKLFFEKEQSQLHLGMSKPNNEEGDNIRNINKGLTELVIANNALLTDKNNSAQKKLNLISKKKNLDSILKNNLENLDSIKEAIKTLENIQLNIQSNYQLDGDFKQQIQYILFFSFIQQNQKSYSFDDGIS